MTTSRMAVCAICKPVPGLPSYFLFHLDLTDGTEGDITENATGKQLGRAMTGRTITHMAAVSENDGDYYVIKLGGQVLTMGPVYPCDESHSMQFHPVCPKAGGLGPIQAGTILRGTTAAT